MAKKNKIDEVSGEIRRFIIRYTTFLLLSIICF
ncbi:hypothetical protein ECH_0437 [Ehrlichia chaffeensis str. Arkansas]|uniref:Uncharacterized protein n=1 Tax=Ehrlichia chaffeensis (strain ATCC CRL-10679 / Arkansas) TaxID=205920 RepID=Q2GH28_EHRCR|nr:hypothetical protein ECH_0437 [Ehrlichia chaffeensis str. Arkansas]